MAPFAETDLAGDGGFNINDSPPLVESNLGDIITDSFIQASNAAYPAKPTRIAVEANGVIRSGIPKGGRASSASTISPALSPWASTSPEPRPTLWDTPWSISISEDRS